MTPGPNGLLALTHGGLFGARRTMATALGGVSGFAALIVLSISGLGALLMASDQLFQCHTLARRCVCCDWGIAPGGLRSCFNRPSSGRDNTRSIDSLFSKGLVVALCNPKPSQFFAAFLRLFLNPAGSLLLQFVTMAVTLAVIEFLFVVGLTASSERLLPWLSKDRNSRWFQRTTGVVFVGAGAAILVLHR